MNNKSRILFLCPDSNKVFGGIKQLYRHVDILTKNKMDAYIMHTKKKFRVTWFRNETPIVHSLTYQLKIASLEEKCTRNKGLKHLKYKFKLAYYLILEKIVGSNTILDSDIIVIPEVYGVIISKVFSKNKKIIFNQNCYYTFIDYPLQEKIVSPYTHPDTISTIVASQDAYNYMSFVFPKIKLFRIRLGIDNKIFNYQENKLRQIAFMPRKFKEDVEQVISILKERNVIPNWSFVQISNLSEEDVALKLKESAVFLSFNKTEGFGLPPAEAMACGCVVVGYKGRGGEEYFKPSFSYPVEDRDIITFVKTIEDVCKLYDTNRELFIKKGKEASQFILSEYSLENEEKDIINLWSNELNL